MIRELRLGSLTLRMGANAPAAAQARATSSSWSAGMAKKCCAAETSTGGESCISSDTAAHAMRDRVFMLRPSRRQATAAVPSDFSDRGETLSLKCGWRLCVCSVRGPCEPLFTGSCVIRCSACVLYFYGVGAAARTPKISHAWSGEYAWSWQMHRLLSSSSTCGACVRAVCDYS